MKYEAEEKRRRRRPGVVVKRNLSNGCIAEIRTNILS